MKPSALPADRRKPEVTISHFSPPPLSLRASLAAHETDPAHRFHLCGAHDFRAHVAAGGAQQRMRGRRHD